MRALQALGSGLTGALTLTAMHEMVRQGVSEAPRMDILGERAIARSMVALGQKPPSGRRLHKVTLGGDILSNSLYYSLVSFGEPETAPRRGAILGAAAGIGALCLPGPMGLGKAPSNRTTATQIMTVGWYLLGGLAAGATYRLLANGRG